MAISPPWGDSAGHMNFGGLRSICELATAGRMGGTMARYVIYGADDLAERYDIPVRDVVRLREPWWRACAGR
jgi:hypothetical protein